MKKLQLYIKLNFLKNLFRYYADVIIIDSTFNVIDKKWSLFSLIGLNGGADSIIFCYFLIKDERYITLSKVFDELNLHNDFGLVQIVLCDKD